MTLQSPAFLPTTEVPLSQLPLLISPSLPNLQVLKSLRVLWLASSSLYLPLDTHGVLFPLPVRALPRYHLLRGTCLDQIQTTLIFLSWLVPPRPHTPVLFFLVALNTTSSLLLYLFVSCAPQQNVTL